MRAVETTLPATGSPHLASVSAPLRIAFVDAETAFTRPLVSRVEVLGWRHRVLPVAPPPDDLAVMKLNAVVIDPESCGEDPWGYLARLTAALPHAGLLAVSGSSSVADRVRGLRLGIDDWIVKPSHPEEVLARVQAVVRRHARHAPEPRSDPMLAGELQIRPDRYQAYVGSQSTGLTRREYELVAVLAGAEGQVLQRGEIYRRVWGYAMPRGDRSVDVFVRKLRQKLAAASPGWRYIHTHFGVGYRFGAEPVTARDE